MPPSSICWRLNTSEERSECIWRKYILFVYICTVFVRVFHKDMWVYTCLRIYVKATGRCLLFLITSLHLLFWDGISQRTWLLLFQAANPGNHLIPLPPTHACRCHAIYLFSMSARGIWTHARRPRQQTLQLTQLGGAYSSVTHTLLENARTQAHREETTWRPRSKQPCRAKRKDLRKTSPANSIILDSSLQKEGQFLWAIWSTLLSYGRQSRPI